MGKMLDLAQTLPKVVRDRVDPYLEAADVLGEVHDPRVLASIGPSGIRGLLLKRGKQDAPTDIPSRHHAQFDWSYPSDHPEMYELYRRAKAGQWDGETYLPWRTSVDPYDPNTAIVPDEFFAYGKAEEMGVKLTAKEQADVRMSLAAWMLSQFLHGEQGALLASAQVTESVTFFDGRLYGATQVMDEARHVEVFHRYLDRKLGKVYQVNDNLFVIIDALMRDSRWDMKFLGMQIMVEGLALGAFGMIYKVTREPLLRELLKMVIQDEARHVHYGVLALRDHITKELTASERKEREDWAFEVALLMRNRFMAYEVYDEWFAHKLSRAEWRELVTAAPMMEEFRRTMFSRMVPNLRDIGLLSDRIKPAYERVGLMKYFGGKSATELDSGEKLLAELQSA
jgi:hypothetical protein